MRPKISSDLQNDQISEILEKMRSSGVFFTDWNKFQLDKFRDHFRFLTFQPKQQLARRNEPVDFLGVILKGNADIILDHKSQSIIGAGDVIGGMSFFRMPGCEVQQFDIYAKESGIMALIRKDDIKLLSKREPELNAQLMKSLQLKILGVVNQQFTDEDYSCLQTHTPSITTFKKIMLYLDNIALTKEQVLQMNNPRIKKNMTQSLFQDKTTFRNYWNELEQREKRLFIQYSIQIDLDPQEILIKENQKGDQFYILVHGEVQDINNNKFYKSGQLIGLKNFLTQEGFRETYTTRSKCVLIRISRAYFEDMIRMSPVSANNITAMLTRYECDQIRKTFENRFPNEKQILYTQVEILIQKMKNPDKPIPKRDQFTIPQLLDNYFELSINKTKLCSLDLIEKEKQQTDIAPLYILDTFKDLVAKRGFQGNEIKDRRDPMIVSGMSWFMREKVEEQKKEAIKRKLEEKKLRKLGGSIQIKKEQFEEQIPINQEADIFEELNNDYYHLKAELDRANEYIYLLEEQVQQLKDQARQKNEEQQIIQTRLYKVEMHRELIRLDRFRDDFMDDMYLKKRITLFDTFKQQAQDGKIYKSAITAADKMISSLYQQKMV